MAKTSGVWSVLGALVALGSVTGCDPVGSEWTPTPSSPTSTTPTSGRALFAGKVTRASSKVAPIAGGTLLITKSQHAVASDPDRDAVHVVDLGTQTVKSIALEPGDEPGRAVEGADGTVYVAARRGGIVAAIDLANATAVRIPVCAAPRGVAYDSETANLYVACRSGLLAVIDTASNEVSQRYKLDADLRDVVVSGDELVVSRFKNAEVMVVSKGGEVMRRSSPKIVQSGAPFTPSVAYRTLAAPGGGVLVGHVDSSNVQLPSGAGAYYGSPCVGSVADLSLSVMQTGASAPAGSAPAGSGTLQVSTSFSQAMGGMSGPLDLSFTQDGTLLAVLAAGNSWSPDGTTRPNLYVTPASALSPSVGLGVTCVGSTGTAVGTSVKGEPVAVAFDEYNAWVVQSRQPAQLQLQNGSVISLASDDRTDTGLAIFHMNTGGGISCQSCHPEAGEDGHTWNFSVGLRRSQALQGGASKRAPFHWSGDLVTFDNLFDEVMMKRMSLQADVNPDQRAALRDWLDSVPRESTADDLDPDSVERGRALFEDKKLACATCHGGSDYTDNVAHDVGTGAAFITPSLVGVNLRAPLFHDGCAADLAGRFGPCGGGDAHGVTSHLTAEDRADLVAFMQAL